jgi:PRTRC genetic system protein E
MFTEISNLLKEGEMLCMNIRKSGREMLVVVLPKVTGVTDPAAEQLIPLNLKGSPEELDAGFIQAISRPVLQSTALMTNMAEYEKSAEKAARESKAEKDRQDTIAKHIKDAETAEKAGKTKEALAAYTKALELDRENIKIKLKINGLKMKLTGCPDIFAATPVKEEPPVEQPEDFDCMDDTNEDEQSN